MQVLSGRRLLIARVGWVIVAAVAIGLFVWSLPSHYDRLLARCAGGDSCYDWQLSREGVRAAKDLGLSPDLFAAVGVAVDAAFAFVWCAVGALVFWRRSRDRGALVVGLFLVVFETTSGDTLDALAAGAPPGMALLIRTVSFLGVVLLILFFCLFPDGRFVPRWVRWVALLWALVWMPTSFFPTSPLSLDNASAPVILACLLGLLLSGVAAQIYRYRRVSGAVERQQTKWAVFGVVVAIGGFAILILVEAAFPVLRRSGTLTYVVTQPLFTVFMLFIPISIGAAMVRSRLYDIDVVINRALVYGPLTVTLVGLYVAVIVVLQRLFVLLTGERSTLAVVASTLAIAALFSPLRSRVQGFVDRRFYRRKYDAAKTLEAFSARLREETDLGALADELVGVVGETMQPAHISLWLRPEANQQREQTGS